MVLADTNVPEAFRKDNGVVLTADTHLMVSYFAHLPLPRKSTSISIEAAFSVIKCNTLRSNPVKRKGSEHLPAVYATIRPSLVASPNSTDHVLPNQMPLCG